MLVYECVYVIYSVMLFQKVWTIQPLKASGLNSKETFFISHKKVHIQKILQVA